MRVVEVFPSNPSSPSPPPPQPPPFFPRAFAAAAAVFASHPNALFVIEYTSR